MGQYWLSVGLTPATNGHCTSPAGEVVEHHGTQAALEIPPCGLESQTTREQRESFEAISKLPDAVKKAVFGWDALPVHVQQTLTTILESIDRK